MNREMLIPSGSPQRRPESIREMLDRVAEVNAQLAKHGLREPGGYRLAPALGGKLLGFPGPRRKKTWDPSPPRRKR